MEQREVYALKWGCISAARMSCVVSGWPSRLMLRSLKSSHAPSTYSPSTSLPAEKQRKVTSCSWQLFACGWGCGTQEVIAHLSKNANHSKRSNLNHMVLRTQISTSHPVLQLQQLSFTW